MESIYDPISFGGVNLKTVEGLTVTGSSTYRFASRKLQNYGIAYQNRSTTTSAFKSGKTINISCVIARSSRSGFDNSLDQLAYLTDPKNQTLLIPVRGSYYEYHEVTLSNMAVSNVKGGYGEIDLEFIAADPHSYDTITTEVLNMLNVTSGDKSYPVYFEGTANQQPVFTLTLDSVVGGTGGSITISNPTTGQSITIQRVWSASDVLVIDCESHSVTVNDDEVDSTGMFPEWGKGDGFINYTDTFTERQVDINGIYTKRYLT